MKIYEYVNHKVIDSQQSIVDMNESIKILMHTKADLCTVGLIKNSDLINRFNDLINKWNMLEYDVKLEVQKNLFDFKEKGVFDKN